MTEPVIPTSRVLTMSYSRTVQVKQFEPAVVSATMEATLPPGTTVDQAREVFGREYAALKGEVLRQHGLTFTLDDVEQRVMETFAGAQIVGIQPGIEQQPPVQQAQPAPQQQMQQVPNQPNEPQPMPGTTPAGNPNPFAAPGGAVEQPQGQVDVVDPNYARWQNIVMELQASSGYMDDGNKKMNSWYDNRLNKRNEKGPDFKHKNEPDPNNPQYKVSLWLRDCPLSLKAQLG